MADKIALQWAFSGGRFRLKTTGEPFETDTYLYSKDTSDSSAPSRSISPQKKDLLIALGLFLLCIMTRLIAIPASLWEWDDILFAHALHKFDLTAHSPHPPGFPVFVMMTRAAYWILGDEHRALTSVAFIFASLVAPALYYFYRAVFEDRRIAFAGAILASFAPNVWVHSGAGRSDGVAFTLGIIGLTLVIHGFHSQRSLIAGCAVFGLAMGVRTTLLPVMVPVITLVFIARLRRREWRGVVAGLAVGTLCVLIWFLPMVYHVTWPIYRSVMNQHSQYIFKTDTIFSFSEDPWLFHFYRFRRFFVHIWGTKWIMDIIYAFSALGLFSLAFKRQWKTIGLMGIAFLPYLIFTVVLNAPLGGPLYSLPYIPFFTGLAAYGLILVPGSLFYPVHWRVLKNSGLFLAICLTIAIAGWTYPIIRLLHREVSPPVRAFDYLKQNLDPENDLLLYDGLFSPYVSLYLPNHRRIQQDEILQPEANLIWSITDHPHIISLTRDPLLGMEGEHFIWKSSNLAARRLSKVSLERFFGAHITALSNPRGILFLSGWYGVEFNEKEMWRWMLGTGKVALRNLAESMTLRIRGSILDSPNPDRRRTIVFRMNGTEINRINIDRTEFDHQLTIKTNPSLLWSILSIEIDQTITEEGNSVRDNHKPRLKCFNLEWLPVPGALQTNSSPDQYLGPGWGGLENDKYNYWRWTSGSSITHLPAIEGNGRLDIKMAVPTINNETEGEVEVKVGGMVLEKFRPPNDYFIKSYKIPQSLHRNAKLDLKISLLNETSKSNAIQIFYMGWRPSEKN